MSRKAKKPGQQEVDRSTWNVVIKDTSTTACKHGTGNCDVCGSYNRGSVRHTTRGGDGKVAELRKKSRK